MLFSNSQRLHGPFGSVGLHGVASLLSLPLGETDASAPVRVREWVKGEGRAWVGSGLIGVLGNEPLTFILSPLEGERRQKTEAIRAYQGSITSRCAPADQSAQPCSIFREGFIRIAVQPVLARLRGGNHRVSAGARVFAGVLIRRAVAAQRDSTRLACSEMHPI